VTNHQILKNLLHKISAIDYIIFFSHVTTKYFAGQQTIYTNKLSICIYIAQSMVIIMQIFVQKILY